MAASPSPLPSTAAEFPLRRPDGGSERKLAANAMVFLPRSHRLGGGRPGEKCRLPGRRSGDRDKCPGGPNLVCSSLLGGEVNLLTPPSSLGWGRGLPAPCLLGPTELGEFTARGTGDQRGGGQLCVASGAQGTEPAVPVLQSNLPSESPSSGGREGNWPGRMVRGEGGPAAGRGHACALSLRDRSGAHRRGICPLLGAVTVTGRLASPHERTCVQSPPAGPPHPAPQGSSSVRVTP